MNGSSAAFTSAGVPEGDSYTSISYISNPFPQSAPQRAFGLARLFGLTAPDLATMRVLELGCASGGNIIPLAAQFPRGRFLGFDLAPRHVAEAKSRLTALRLDNIDIRQGDIAALDLGDQQFDAIVCHGVYSWVPPAARDAILDIAGRRLAPNGVAYISYNVFPGWHLRSAIRDLMLFHAGTEEQASSEQRIAKARWVIDNVAKITAAGSPYGAKLREEAAMLAKVSDSYILGEFLVPYNAPCYFRDFAASAEKHGLAFLCEAEVDTCIPENHGQEVAQLIRTMSSNQLVPMEQYIDYFMGRQFRQSLFVRADQAAKIDRQLTPARLSDIPVSGKLDRDRSNGDAEPYVFQSQNGRNVTTSSPMLCKALERLSAAFPETRTAGALKDEAIRAGEEIGANGEAEILDLLFKMVIAGVVKVSGEPLRLGSANASRPVASRLARADAAAGRAWTANFRHEAITLDAVMQVLLPHLDGSCDRERMRELLTQAVVAGRVAVTDNKTGDGLTGQPLMAAIAEHVDLAISRLSAAALLRPDGARG